MMGRQDRDQRQLFYEFNLDEMIPKSHLLRRVDVFVTAVLSDLHEQLNAFYSDIGRPSVDPELLIYTLSRASLERMQRDDPAADEAFLRFVIRTLSDRLELAHKEAAALI